MSDPSSQLPARASLEQLQKQAKDLLREYRQSGRADKLADAQFAIARQYGFASWAHLKHHLEAAASAGMKPYEQLAADLASAYMRGDAEAVREINWNHGTSFMQDRDPANMQRRLTAWYASEGRAAELAAADARRMVARSFGFASWEDFSAGAQGTPGDPAPAPVYFSRARPFYRIDWGENRLSVRGPQSAGDWDRIAAAVKEHGIARLDAGGMSDEGMERISRLDGLTHLHAAHSKALTDEGAQHLARMPQLVELELGGWGSALTDRALEPLRHLAGLRRFHAVWVQAITDRGAAHLACCRELEDVNLMGTQSGDGAIRALAGKPNLRKLSTGTGATDNGLALLGEFPVFKTWRGGDGELPLMSAQDGPNHLTLDGPFTAAGLAALRGLEGLFGLTFFWHCPNLTAAGLEALRHLPRLAVLGIDGKNCDDAAMQQIAKLPHLRKLLAQGTVASDSGFEALSRSATIEFLWGRECPNLTGRGFSALAAMPALRGLAVSCKFAGDAALSVLPRFPALRELMPMDVPDAGFHHVGRCENLERLWCMYCRETGDAATEQIARLPNLKTYYAGMTRITDRSLEILSRMDSLEELEFWQCAGLTDAGVASLCRLPRLREIGLSGLPEVTRKAAALFPPRVKVKYSG